MLNDGFMFSGELENVQADMMELRDMFAGQALIGSISLFGKDVDKKDVARWCFDWADAMMIVRNEINEE